MQFCEGEGEEGERSQCRIVDLAMQIESVGGIGTMVREKAHEIHTRGSSSAQVKVLDHVRSHSALVGQEKVLEIRTRCA